MPARKSLKKHAEWAVLIILSISLYYRWLPIYSGFLLILALSTYIILNLDTKSKNNIRYSLALFSGCVAVHLNRVLQDSWNEGFQNVFRLDILNIITTIALFLALRSIDLRNFFEKIRLSQILAGTSLAFAPILLLVFLIGFSFFPEASTISSSAYLDFIRTNIDYNVIAFLLLLSLNSLFYSNFSNKTTLTLSTLISMGILYSSSRRAFIILLLLIPLAFTLKFLFGATKGAIVALGIILSFTLSSAVLLYALVFPVQSYQVATATIQPLLRPLSLFLIPEDFNRLHYKTIFQINDHRNYNTDDTTVSRSIGELALAPRENRIKTAKSIISSFETKHHLIGQSFHLKTFGRAHQTNLDYPHNFLITTYISTGIFGFLLNIITIALAYYGLWTGRKIWNLEPTIAFTITIVFCLTSGFSQWSFLPLGLYMTIGLISFFSNPSESTSKTAH